MKMPCATCGCHFPEDFEETLEPHCTWWQTRGFPVGFQQENTEWCRKVWDWTFSIDRDAFADDTGFMLSAGSIKCDGPWMGNQFEGKDENKEFAHCPGYEDWPDEKRRQFQKDWMKYYYNGLVPSMYQKFCEGWEKNGWEPRQSQAEVEKHKQD